MDNKKVKYLRVLAAFIGFLPTVWLIWLAVTNGLGADPIKEEIHFLGGWGLNFIILALFLRAFTKVSNNVWLNILHKTAGFYAYYYVSLHFWSYIGLDQFFNLHDIIEDTLKHKRIIVGFTAYITLGTVVFTSLKRVTKKIGYLRWKTVHKLTYIIPILAVIHYMWMKKIDIRIPLIYAAIIAFLIISKTIIAFHYPSKPK